MTEERLNQWIDVVKARMEKRQVEIEGIARNIERDVSDHDSLKTHGVIMAGNIRDRSNRLFDLVHRQASDKSLLAILEYKEQGVAP